jgi:hypothetical protein
LEFFQQRALWSSTCSSTSTLGNGHCSKLTPQSCQDLWTQDRLQASKTTTLPWAQSSSCYSRLALSSKQYPSRSLAWSDKGLKDPLPNWYGLQCYTRVFLKDFTGLWNAHRAQSIARVINQQRRIKSHLWQTSYRNLPRLLLEINEGIMDLNLSLLWLSMPGHDVTVLPITS